jgi:hypothetical protein
MKTISALLACVLLPLPALATFQEEYDALKDSGKNFEVTGTICEEVARRKIEKIHAKPQFEVITGIAYGDNKRTIGELDVVVFDARSKEAVKIMEVKCWRKLDGGLSKAREQRSRFLKTISKTKALYFESTTDHSRFDYDQFDTVRDFTTIGQKGAKRAGYEDELDLELNELMDLRERIMDCQRAGACRSASN